MVLIKGIIAATRSVGATLVLLIILTYVAAIIFTGQYRKVGELENATENDAYLQEYFGSMPLSMFTLIITGTLLDDLTTLVYVLLEDSQIMLWVLIFFILVSNFTVFNMLIGILCEVVTATKEGEEANQAEAAVREVLEDVFDDIDKDKSGKVSSAEFEEMLKNDVDMIMCNSNAEDVLYQDVFDTMLDRYPSFRMVHCITGKVPSWPKSKAEIHNGRICKEVLKITKPGTKGIVSGPRGLCRAATDLWAALGQDPENLTALDEVGAPPEATVETEAKGKEDAHEEGVRKNSKDGLYIGKGSTN